jgi:hypothetical protein
MNSKAQQLFQPNILLFLLILVNIMVGSLIVSDYGGGWDDVVEFERGEQSYAFYYDETAD